MADPYAGIAHEEQADPYGHIANSEESASILDRAWSAVKGTRDALDAGIKTVFEQFPNELQNTTAMAATLGASDAQMADVIQKGLGNKFVRREKDNNGYDIFVTRGPDGKEQRGYVNSPGLDTQDVVRGVRGALPYFLTGSVAAVPGIGRGVLANSILQGATAAETSAGGDFLLEDMGSQQGIEGGKALAAGAMGFVGPVASAGGSALWRRFVTEPRYFNRGTGQLTPRGEAMARQLGVDPQTLTDSATKELARTMAMGPQEAAQAVGSGKLEFGIPQTLGQRTKDQEQLLIEKAMRAGGYGDQAKSVIGGLDSEQAKKVEEAARGVLPRQYLTNTNGSQISPQMRQHINSLPAVTLEKDTLGQYVQNAVKSVRKGAKAAEKFEWDKTTPLDIVRSQSSAPDAMTPMTGVGKAVSQNNAKPLLDEHIRQELGDLANVFDPANTPVAFKMGEVLDQYMKGSAPTTRLHSAFGIKRQDSVDAIRRTIGRMSKDAETPTDREAAGALYKAYNDWMKKAAEHGLLTGDVQEVGQFVRAIDKSREINNLFKPLLNGKPTAGSKIIEKVMASDTPENVVDAIFSAPTAGIKPGSIEAIRLMRKAADKYGSADDAVDVWGSMKVAHWSKLVQDKQGNMFTPTVMRNNIKASLGSQYSLVRELYSKQDLAMMRRFVKALDGIVWKDPNGSGTATALVSLMKNMFGRFMNFVPGSVRAGLEFTGLPKAYGTAVAKKAVSQVDPLRSEPFYGPAFGSVGAESYRYRNSR